MTTARENLRTFVETVAAELGDSAAGDSPEYRAARIAELKTVIDALKVIEVYETTALPEDAPGSFEIMVQGVS